MLVAGILASTWQATRARRAERAAIVERDRAAEAEASANSVNEFLQNDLLAQASANNQARPDTKPDPDLKVRTALDRAAARIGGKFDKAPLVEAGIRLTIGKTYQELGLYPDAEAHLGRALELQRRIQSCAHRARRRADRHPLYELGQDGAGDAVASSARHTLTPLTR